MRLDRLMLPLTLTLAAPLAAQVDIPGPVLDIELAPYTVEFTVTTRMEPFVGVVIAALNPDQAHYLVGLPPLLADPVVLGFGVGDAGTWTLALPEANFPNGIFVYAQGVVLTDVITATGVEKFVLDVTVPEEPLPVT